MMAILLDEPDGAVLLHALSKADAVFMGAPTIFELRLSMFRRLGERSVVLVDELLAFADVRVVRFEADHVALAFEALTRFSKAPAWLNYGDCMSYAVARALGIPLLYKGLDFTATDIPQAPYDA